MLRETNASVGIESATSRNVLVSHVNFVVGIVANNLYLGLPELPGKRPLTTSKLNTSFLVLVT